jgi:hypothetical protein
MTDAPTPRMLSSRALEWHVRPPSHHRREARSGGEDRHAKNTEKNTAATIRAVNWLDATLKGTWNKPARL